MHVDLPGLGIWKSRKHFEPATRKATSTQTGTPKWSLPLEQVPKPSGTSGTKRYWNKITQS